MNMNSFGLYVTPLQLRLITAVSDHQQRRVIWQSLAPGEMCRAPLDYAAARFAALAARAFARFATSAAFRAGDIFLFTGAGSAALTASHRFLVAAMIAFLPAAESFRFFLGAASGIDG